VWINIYPRIFFHVFTSFVYSLLNVTFVPPLTFLSFLIFEYADGTVLNEGLSVHLYLSSLNPSAGLVPAYGTKEFFVFANDFSFVGTEIHARLYGPQFNPNLSAEVKTSLKEAASAKLFPFFTDKMLGEKHFLGGDAPNSADIYMYICLSWSGYVGLTLPPKVQAYYERVKAVPFVAEGHGKIATYKSA